MKEIEIKEKNVLVKINGCSLSQQEEEIIRNELIKNKLGNNVDKTINIKLDENIRHRQLAEIVENIACAQHENLILVPTMPLPPVVLRLLLDISWLDGCDTGLGAGSSSVVYLLYNKKLIRI